MFGNGKFNNAALEQSIDILSRNISLIVPGEDEVFDLDTTLERIKAQVIIKGINAFIIDPWNEIESDQPPLDRESPRVGSHRRASRIQRQPRAAAVRSLGSSDSPPPTIFYCSNFPQGYLHILTDTLLSAEEESLLVRFTRVFEQTYTRFLDLKKAEAQAREAQIEAALERVRSRAMAMQRSDELREVVGKVFEAFQQLDFGAPTCCIGIFDEATRSSEWWVSSVSEVILPRSYHIPYLEGWPKDWYQMVYNNWQQGVPYFTCTFEGEEKRAFDRMISEETEFGLIGDSSFTDVIPLESMTLSYARMTHGVLEVGTHEPIPDDQLHILHRFGSVIDLTYTRFDDLQQAEARAREAVREASLDRVRAEIASMRTADDLERITPLVWRELTTLGVPFFRCGVFIMDETTEHIRAYLTNPQGESLAALNLPFDIAEITRKAVAHWRVQQVYPFENAR